MTISVVQKTSNVEFSGVGSTSFTNTPTVGNLILAVGAANDGNTPALTAKDGWTLIFYARHPTATENIYAYYKYSDGAKVLASPNSGNVSSRYDMIFMEVSGVSSNWSAAFVGATTATYATSAWGNLNAPVSTASGQIGVSVFANYEIFGTAPTITAPWSTQYSGGLFFNQYGVAVRLTASTSETMVASINWNESASSVNPVVGIFLLGDGTSGGGGGGSEVYFRTFPTHATLFPTDQNRTFPRT